MARLLLLFVFLLVGIVTGIQGGSGYFNDISTTKLIRRVSIKTRRICSCLQATWSTGLIDVAYQPVQPGINVWWEDEDDKYNHEMIVKIECKDCVKNGRFQKKLYLKIKLSMQSKTIQYCEARPIRVMYKTEFKCIGTSTYGKKVSIGQLDRMLPFSIITWKDREGTDYWGTVNQWGKITAFSMGKATKEFRYFIMRMFAHFLIKNNIINKGWEVKRYSILWDGVGKSYEPPNHPRGWFIPIWLPASQRIVRYEVVIYQGRTQIEYIGPKPDKEVMVMTVKVKGSSGIYFIWFKVKVIRNSEGVDILHMCRKVSNKMWERWIQVDLQMVARALKLTMVTWQTIEGVTMSGFVNSDGDIIGYHTRNKFLTLTINRMYLNYLLLREVIQKGFKVIEYKIHYEGQIIVGPVTLVREEQLLIPTWLINEVRRMVWKVVKIQENGEWKIRVIYIGGRVTSHESPDFTLCTKEDDGFGHVGYADDLAYCNMKIADIKPPVTPVIVYPPPSPFPVQCGSFNEYGRCLEDYYKPGYCTCTKFCTCVDPFEKYTSYTKRDAIFPTPQIGSSRYGASSL